MKLGTSGLLHFQVILTRQYIFEIILFIQGDHQGQFQSQVRENIFFNK